VEEEGGANGAVHSPKTRVDGGQNTTRTKDGPGRGERKERERERGGKRVISHPCSGNTTSI